MAESSLYAGERDGARVFQVGRLGFDQGTQDLSATVYTGTYRTERISPAGPNALVNYRRVAIHLLVSGSYTFTVKVWINDGRTQLGVGTEQEVTVTGTAGALQEVTEEIEIEGNSFVAPPAGQDRQLNDFRRRRRLR
jgi:hypothetical protein